MVESEWADYVKATMPRVNAIMILAARYLCAKRSEQLTPEIDVLIRPAQTASDRDEATAVLVSMLVRGHYGAEQREAAIFWLHGHFAAEGVWLPREGFEVVVDGLRNVWLIETPAPEI